MDELDTEAFCKEPVIKLKSGIQSDHCTLLSQDLPGIVMEAAGLSGLEFTNRALGLDGPTPSQAKIHGVRLLTFAHQCTSAS